MSKDLILHHKFTDRGGDQVYDAFDIDDRLEMKNKLFEIRINLEKDFDLDEVAKVESHGTG